jgi:hypothetical protein
VAAGGRRAPAANVIAPGDRQPLRRVPGPQDIISERVPDRPNVRDDAVTIALRMPHRLLEPLVL